jgi:hypothetical protein
MSGHARISIQDIQIVVRWRTPLFMTLIPPEKKTIVQFLLSQHSLGAKQILVGLFIIILGIKLGFKPDDIVSLLGEGVILYNLQHSFRFSFVHRHYGGQDSLPKVEERIIAITLTSHSKAHELEEQSRD